MRALKAVVKFFGSGLRAGFALIGILAMGSALANYNMTIPGSGTLFASTVISTVHYANMMLCDFVAGNTQCAAVDSSGNVAVKDAAVLAAVQAAIPAGTNLIGNVGTGVYPAGSTPITASATGTTTATTATLAANASLHTYICGFSIRANATGAATNNATVTGTVTGTLNYTQWTAPLASGLGVTEQIFSPCVISSAVNTGIAVVSGAPGSGGVVSVTAWGFQL